MIQSFRQIGPYMKAQRGILCVAYACTLVLALSTAIYAALMGPALKFIFTGRIQDVLRTPRGELREPLATLLPTDWIHTMEGLDSSSTLWIIPAAIVVLAVIKGLAQATQFVLFGRASQGVLQALREDAFASLLRQSPEFYNRKAHGDLLSRLTHDANLVEQALFYGYASIVRDSLAVLGLLCYVFYADPKLALVTFVTLPMAILPLIRFARWLKRVSRRGQEAQAALNAVSYESLAGIRVVQAFAQEPYEMKRMRQAGDRYRSQMFRSYLVRGLRSPTMEILGAFALAALVALLAYHVRSSGADTAHYISFLGAIFLMYDPLKKLGKVSDYLAAGASALERISDITMHAPAVQSKPGATALPSLHETPDEKHGIVFDSVTFRYAGQGHNVLRDLSFSMELGTMVALVGASGSGKTTTANLLARFCDVSSGSIKIIGHDVRDITLESLRHQLSIVSQDTFLFNTTIAANIAYGVRDADPIEVERAARNAFAHDFITQLPQGYQTIVGERGVTLSGGQRQRIAIARALLRDCPILILDEATSSLDIESERFVQQALDRLLAGRTALVIAHRLSTVMRADLICVLKDGTLCEQGSHHELLATGGEYARLHAMQFDEQSAKNREEIPQHV